MIIYGISSKQAKVVKIENLECGDCDTPGSIVGVIFRKYFHVYWIPFFPVGLGYGGQCQHCKAVIKEEHFTQEGINYLKQHTQDIKVPIWTFSGLIIIGILILYFKFFG